MALIIYSLNTGRVRTVLIDELKADSLLLEEYLPRLDVQEGSEFIDVLDEAFSDLDLVQAEVTLRTGLTPSDDRYLVFDSENGEVDSAIMADHLIDSVPGKSMVAHERGGLGWRVSVSHSSFERPIEDIDDEITTKESYRDYILSGRYEDDNPELTPEELAADRAAANQAVSVLIAEQSSRNGSRP